jgi:hypothetical protein
MSCFLYVDDTEDARKINIDDLYEKKKQKDLKQLSIFNKILNRIHKRITHTSRNKSNDLHIWFTIPEYIFGEPLYDKGDCTGYLVTKLEENGFHVRYLHPNTLFVSWKNWVPSYVRTEIKKKTGIVLDEKGTVIDKMEKDDNDPNARIFNERQNMGGKDGSGKGAAADAKQYTPIDKYKPTGNLVYNQEMFDKLEKKIEKRVTF